MKNWNVEHDCVLLKASPVCWESFARIEHPFPSRILVGEIEWSLDLPSTAPVPRTTRWLSRTNHRIDWKLYGQSNTEWLWRDYQWAHCFLSARSVYLVDWLRVEYVSFRIAPETFESMGIAFDTLREPSLSRGRTYSTRKRSNACRKQQPMLAASETDQNRLIEHLTDLRTEMFNSRSIRCDDTIVIQQRLGFVFMIEDFDFQRIIRLEVLSIESDLHATDKRRFEIHPSLHQQTFGIRCVENNLSDAWTN